MNRIPCARLVLTAAVLALLVVPMAGARPVEAPRQTERMVTGWFDAAMRWFEGVSGFRRPSSDRTGTSGSQDNKISSATTSGGSCIDPVGHCNK
ncbi:MAG TPA: hypothetical protein VKK31_26475 [Thermoanaerobaculia bacterium]|nr:hypothetical protein [Thermoanaerobaculia bacterium]